MKLINCLRPYGEHYKTLLKDIKEDSQNEWLYFQWMGRLKKWQNPLYLQIQCHSCQNSGSVYCKTMTCQTLKFMSHT